MARRELLDLGRFWRIGRARGHSQQEIAKVFPIGDREKFKRIDDHVGIAAIRQMKLERHAMRIGLLRAIRQIGTPVASEKRTVTGMVPLNRIALLSNAASGVALK